jgi:hypothetical protein
MTEPEVDDDILQDEPEIPDELHELIGDIRTAAATLFLTKDRWHEPEFRRSLSHFLAAYAYQTRAHAGIREKFAEANLGDKAQIILAVRALKQSAKETEKVANKLLPDLERDMVMAIAENGIDKFQTPTHSFTAKADSYLSTVPKPGDKNWSAYQEWLKGCPDPNVRQLIDVTLPEDEYQRLAEVLPALREAAYLSMSDRCMEKLCRMLLEDGQDLPPGVTTFIKPSISIRRRG